VALLVILCQLATEGYLSRTLGGTTSERIVDVVGARWPVVLGKEAGAEVDGMLKRLRLDAAGGKPAAGSGTGAAPEAPAGASKPGTVR
jgi:hypothetical protein